MRNSVEEVADVLTIIQYNGHGHLIHRHAIVWYSLLLCGEGPLQDLPSIFPGSLGCGYRLSDRFLKYETSQRFSDFAKISSQKHKVNVHKMVRSKLNENTAHIIASK
jgi:hypothetical protein